MAFLELNLVKDHLSVELEDASFDLRINALIGAAKRACELKTARFLDPDSAPEGSTAAPFSPEDLELAQTACLLQITDWFENRAGDGKVSAPVAWIFSQLHDFSDRG